MQDVLLSLEASATDSAKVQLDDAVAAAETAFKYDFDECDPGERPDTIRLTGLPRRWFRASSQTPSASHGYVKLTTVTVSSASSIDYSACIPLDVKLSTVTAYGAFLT